MAVADFKRAALIAAAVITGAGCATVPASRQALEGEWRVTAIDGQATPSDPDAFMMRFEKDSASARFGCNSIGGDYTMAGSTLTVAHVLSTMMACPGQPVEFERSGLAVLKQPMIVAWSDARHASLSNSAGSIALAR